MWMREGERGYLPGNLLGYSSLFFCTPLLFFFYSLFCCSLFWGIFLSGGILGRCGGEGEDEQERRTKECLSG